MKRALWITGWIALLVLVMLAAAGCENLTGGPYKIVSTKPDRLEVRPGSEATLLVSVGRSGRPQVQHTDTIDVTLSASDSQLGVKPKVTSYEEITSPNTLHIVMRPGATLPREFTFEVQVPQSLPPGEYQLRVSMKANDDTDAKTITLKVN